MSLLSKGATASQIAAASKESFRKTMEVASQVTSETEPAIAPGTTSQYWRGDKTWQTLVVPWVAAPATATSTGTAGQIAYDASYLYVCIATNTWRRTALSTW